MTRALIHLLIILSLSAVSSDHARAEVATDIPTLTTLPEAKPHWVWVGGLGGKVTLIDADTGDYLATLSNGTGLMKLDFPTHAEHFYSTETYYARGTRGERTDVVTLYDRFSLHAVDEIVIPPRAYDGMALQPLTALSDDEAFLYVFNMSPSQSVTVIDLKAKRVSAELNTPGCALIYPTGNRRFQMICGDGAMLTIEVDDAGQESARKRSAVFFDGNADPIMEKAVRFGDRWLFSSFEGQLHEVKTTNADTVFPGPWSLVSDAERAERWRVGGALPIAAHQQRQVFYVLMHQGGIDTHKDPGDQVWAFDPNTRQRTRTIALRRPVTTIQVTQDEQPLLICGVEGDAGPSLDVYDLTTGEFQRTIEEVGAFVATLIQPYARQHEGAP